MYKISRISSRDYKTLKYLFFKSFNHSHSLQSIKLRYDTKVFGLKNVGYIAKKENQVPAAYYGVFPITLNLPG